MSRCPKGLPHLTFSSFFFPFFFCFGCVCYVVVACHRKGCFPVILQFTVFQQGCISWLSSPVLLWFSFDISLSMLLTCSCFVHSTSFLTQCLFLLYRCSCVFCVAVDVSVQFLLLFGFSGQTTKGKKLRERETLTNSEFQLVSVRGCVGGQKSLFAFWADFKCLGLEHFKIG